MGIPIIIKLLTSLAVIVIMNRFAKNLPLSLLGGALVFAVWLGIPIPEIISIGYLRILNLDTGGLLLLIGLVITLSMQMKFTGLIDELVTTIRETFSPRSSLAVIPAMIGLLPMPGGALFSAPLLDHFDDVPGIEPHTKTQINYWFRHIWEYAWPLYPGVIVACDIAGIALWQILFIGIPMSFSTIILGYFFFLSNIGKEDQEERKERKRLRITPFIPVLTVIITYFLIQIFLPMIPEANQYLPMIIGLSIAVISLQIRRPIPAENWNRIVTSKNLYKMMLIILMVRFYGAFIDASIDGVSVIGLMTEEMQALGIPALPLIMGIPFLAGLTMGVSVGFAGSAFPIVIALLGPDPSFGVLAGTFIFAYVCGFMGTMLSPLHVCMIVTCEYYKTGLSSSFKAIIPPAVLMVIIAFLYRTLLILIL